MRCPTSCGEPVRDQVLAVILFGENSLKRKSGNNFIGLIIGAVITHGTVDRRKQ